MPVDKKLIGQNPEFRKEMYHVDIYVDEYLKALTAQYGIPTFDIKANEKKIKSDLEIENKFSGAYSEIEQFIKDAQEHGSWNGVAFDEDGDRFETALDSIRDAKDVEFPGYDIGFRRGLYDILKKGLAYSPNIECDSNFDNRIIIIPSEKLIRYATSLCE